MVSKMITSDTSVIATLCVAFGANLIEMLSNIELSTWFTTGTFILAVIVGLLKARVYYIDCQIKQLQYKHMLEDDEKTDTSPEK